MKEKIHLLFLIVPSAVVVIAGLYFVFGYSPGDLGNLVNKQALEKSGKQGISSDAAVKLATQSVGIFPQQATIDLDWPSLLLRADVNSLPIEARSDKYRVGWYLNGQLLSSESSLTATLFLKAIGNREGNYVINLVVWDKATGAKLGESKAQVTTKKQKPILVVNHWVSAVPGKGMRIWEAISEGRGWYEWDVDLRFEGSTGSIANTLITVAPVLLEDPYYRDSIRGQIGVKSVAPIKNLKDDGTTIDFNVGNATFQLTRTPDGHLKGRYHVPKGEEGNAGWLEWEGTLDLVPAPR